MHETGQFVRALYARGEGRTAPTSELTLSVWLSERCFHTEPAFVMNLLQNGYLSILIDMLIHSVRLPEHYFQFKYMYLEFRSNCQTNNVGRAYYCQLIDMKCKCLYLINPLGRTTLFVNEVVFCKQLNGRKGRHKVTADVIT